MNTRCFMHVPKSAGTSIRIALEQALPPQSIAPGRQDTTLLCGFTDLDGLDQAMRTQLATSRDDIAALANHAVVSGHFSLPTLIQITGPSSIATVIREPRARVLSQFAYWRLSSGLRKTWRGYPPLDHALRPLDEFLAEPQVAQVTDNLLCRMLLGGDSRIPELDFITDPSAIASDAIAVLDTFGFVGAVELPESMWPGLSSFFGVQLSPLCHNTTVSESVDADAPAMAGDVTTRTLGLLSARVAADAIVYRHVLGKHGCSPATAERISAAAFANELVRLGNVGGTSATESRNRGRELADCRRRDDEARACYSATFEQLNKERQLLQEEFARYRGQIEASTSWRVTAPGRATKRAYKRLRAAAGRTRHAPV